MCSYLAILKLIFSFDLPLFLNRGEVRGEEMLGLVAFHASPKRASVLEAATYEIYC
jgi:hypothetical protein